MKSFITGSYAYGTPNEDSDIDLVVLIENSAEISELRKLADKNPDYSHSESPAGNSLRFGKLNLIVCHGEAMFAMWRAGTDFLKKKAPVTRQKAMDYFARKRHRLFGYALPERLREKRSRKYEDDIPF